MLFFSRFPVYMSKVLNFSHRNSNASYYSELIQFQCFSAQILKCVCLLFPISGWSLAWSFYQSYFTAGEKVFFWNLILWAQLNFTEGWRKKTSFLWEMFVYLVRIVWFCLYLTDFDPLGAPDGLQSIQTIEKISRIQVLRGSVLPDYCQTES